MELQIFKAKEHQFLSINSCYRIWECAKLPGELDANKGNKDGNKEFLKLCLRNKRHGNKKEIRTTKSFHCTQEQHRQKWSKQICKHISLS